MSEHPNIEAEQKNESLSFNEDLLNIIKPSLQRVEINPNVVAAINGEDSKEGRPSKCTPETIQKIAKAIADGCTNEEAALIADIDEDTLTNWLKVKEFFGLIKKAQAKRMQIRMNRIDCGVNGWQGTAWGLERHYRERFKPPVERKDVDLTARFDKSVKIKELSESLKQEGFSEKV